MEEEENEKKKKERDMMGKISAKSDIGRKPALLPSKIMGKKERQMVRYLNAKLPS